MALLAEMTTLTSEYSYQITIIGVQGLRVGVKRLPLFNLELVPSQHVVLETTVTSTDDADMARMEDGTVVDGQYWGKLNIVHDGGTHTVDFIGTRIVNPDVLPDMLFDSRVMSKLTIAAKFASIKYHLSILSLAQQLELTWPPAQPVNETKVKYFLRVHPGGALEHFESEMVTTALYYEAVLDPSMVDPNDFITPRNGYATSFRDFVPHFMSILDQLGMSLHAGTNVINNNISIFSAHKNIACHFLSPSKITAVIDISVTSDPCIFTRLFLIFRRLMNDDVGLFVGAGEKEANSVNWREIAGQSENLKDTTEFRLLKILCLKSPRREMHLS
ncbi:hypothetical protein EDD22DRAFT_1029270 [Suillus occidentalis]|nr:hypothetical protein EDD22DRAFT_1029270 [Suillus occidentalis]